MPPDMPRVGQDVVVTLDDGREMLAYRWNEMWWVGVPNDPIDIVLEGIVSWREVV